MWTILISRIVGLALGWESATLQAALVSGGGDVIMVRFPALLRHPGPANARRVTEIGERR